MGTATLVGYVAATLTTLAFIPQVIHTWRSRNMEGISAGMYTAFAIGLAAWIVYGILLGEWPIIAANSLTLIMVLFILVMKLRHSRRPV